MNLQNKSKRLITINDKMELKKDDDGNVLKASHKAKYLIKPAGEPVAVPDTICNTPFVKALLQTGDLIKVDMPDDENADEAKELADIEKKKLADEAKELGIEVKGTWGIKKIQTEIDAKLAE